MEGNSLAIAAGAALTSLAVLSVARFRFRRELLLVDVASKLSRNKTLASGLVAHRGWHYPSDDLRRPLENTLPAYERAWTSCVRFCECDVTLTSDGEIVLCHDDNLKRLALHPSSVSKPIEQCMFRNELEFFPLKDGSRVPLLKEVLQGAKRAGDDKKLVIEIKGNDTVCARKVSELIGNDDLHHQVALVMGFSIESVIEFARTNPKNGIIPSMLLTVRRKGSPAQYFDLDEIENVVTMLKSNNIDGLYLQYDSSYLSDDRFIDLCRQIPIGVWGRHIFDPDNESTAERLLARGARFVNTDFPDRFFRV